jgi:hypothetical protein
MKLSGSREQAMALRTALWASLIGTGQLLDLFRKAPRNKIAFDPQLPRHSENVSTRGGFKTPHIPKGARAKFGEGARIQGAQLSFPVGVAFRFFMCLKHVRHYIKA